MLLQENNSQDKLAEAVAPRCKRILRPSEKAFRCHHGSTRCRRDGNNRPAKSPSRQISRQGSQERNSSNEIWNSRGRRVMPFSRMLAPLIEKSRTEQG